MREIVFGASGMVGQGVLRECLLDASVEAVLCVGRSALSMELTWPALSAESKLRQLVVPDLSNYSAVEQELTGYDACFFTLGVSSAGMNEEEYRRVTYGYTVSAAETLVRLNPAMTFCYISGAGTDSSAQGKTMWARVKGATENALLALPWLAPQGGAYMFRPGAIVPMDGIKSKTKSYRILYTLLSPVIPLLQKLFAKSVTSTRQMGQAMLRVAKVGYPKRILESGDITQM
jgi:hypothetical protein